MHAYQCSQCGTESLTTRAEITLCANCIRHQKPQRPKRPWISERLTICRQCDQWGEREDANGQRRHGCWATGSPCNVERRLVKAEGTCPLDKWG